MDRHNNFTNIPYLDSELDLILRQADELIGRETEHLPPVNQVPDRSRFFIRRADRSWKHYIKLHNSYQALLNYAENLGTGEGRVFKEISDGSLQLRSIKAGLNVSVSEDEDNNILIQSTGTIEELGYTPEDSANKSDDDSLGSSSILYPTQGAVKSYVDAGLSGKADTVHNHVEADITDLDKYTQSEVDSLLSGKADTGHTHDDRYYTETELDGGQLNNLYYTETEVDTLLSGKANTSHTHVEADITDLGSYIEDITEESLSDLQDVTITSIASGEILKWNGTAWINNTLAEAGISATGHTHDDRYYTETETDTLLSGKANTSHTHVEADITDLGNYSVVGHTHVEADITDLGSYLTDITGESIDDLADVDPANKADGRILQYNQSSGNLEYVEPTAGSVSELNDLSDVGDSTPTNRNVLVADGDSWESRALTEADISDLGNYSIVGHTHDDRYYTETEVDTLLSGKADTSHVHSAADITSGTLAVGRGGTGVTSLGTLTKTDDTNVTLTLGGTPSNSLIQSVSLTLGWTGQLGVTRGGTGLSSLGSGLQLLRVNSGATALEYVTPTSSLVGLGNVTNDAQLKIASNLSDLNNAATARTNLGGTTVGSNLFTLTNPSAVRFLRINADNTVSSRTAAELKTDLSLNNVENTALSTWAGSTSITTLGTIGTGTWNASTINVNKGGTGQTTLTANKVLVGNGTTGILQPTELHWDNVNKRLGIGVTSPLRRIHVDDNNGIRLGIRGELISSGFHDSVMLGVNEYYSGSGDPVANQLYMTGAGVNNRAGMLLFFDGNGAETGVRMDVYTADTSTGAGDPVTNNIRFRVTSRGALVQNGSGSEPSLSFIADLDTGLFRAADNTLGFTTAGTERLRISTGRFGFRTTTLSTTVNISPEGGAQGINLMVDPNNSAQSGRFFFSNGTAGQSNTIYNAAGVLNFTTGGTPGSSSGTSRMFLSSTGLGIEGDIYQDDIVRPFFSLAHPTEDIEDITITINKFDNTASANDKMMVHWWVSTTQFSSPNHTGTTGVSYTLGAGESSITSYNHAITDGNRQIKIRLIRGTGQSTITLYLMCEVQGIVFASDSFTIIGV